MSSLPEVVLNRSVLETRDMVKSGTNLKRKDYVVKTGRQDLQIVT